MSKYIDLNGMLDGIVKALPIDQLHPRPDTRPVNEAALAALAESIGEVGLINPIRVTPREDEQGHVRDHLGYEIVAGRHRWQACDLLGWQHVPCVIVMHDSLHAELAMIDENLCRAELSPSERAQQTARRKAIYEQLHPETAHGGNLEGAGVAKFATPEAPSFSRATASVTGHSERTVRLDAERGQKVIPEAFAVIKDTKLDSGAYLDKLKKLPPNLQVAAAKRDLIEERRKTASTGGVANRCAPLVVPPAPTQHPLDRFFALLDEIEEIPIAALLSGIGKRRAVLGQRASSLAERMSDIMERLDD